MKYRFILLVVSIMLIVQGTTLAQEATDEVPPFASVESGRLMITENSAEPEEVYSTAGIQYLAWNPNGTILAFIQRDEAFETAIGIYDAANGEVSLLQTPPLNAGFNLSWMSDGRILFSSESSENDPANNPVFIADILAIEPMADAEPELLGSFEYGVGCGGGSNIPADWVYGEETSGFQGNFLTLTETASGILTSLNCGGTGVGLLNVETDELTIISESLSRVVVSPDGTQVAGIELNYEDPTQTRLLTYNLETLEGSVIETPAAPDLVTWSVDGSSLYYSARIRTGNLIDDLTADEQAALNTALGYEVNQMPAYQSEIYRVSAESSESISLISVDAYAIGRLIPTSSALYYTTISNVGEWLQGVISGEVDPMDFETPPPYIHAEVFRLVEDSEPIPLGEYHQFTPVVTE
jgi:dipeptidyl aminopeptidase/acylaminoacyl peptidase